MYRKNFFGDITAIYQGTTKVAEYVYDAWGNCTITTNVNGYGARNPFRYRGYYYDTETSWYFLNARYYSPEWRRFISPDDASHLNSKSVNGLNLYCYCRNNPVIYKQKAVYSDNAIALAPVSSVASINVGASSSTIDIGNNLKAFAQYIGGMFSTYTDYSRKIVNFPSFDLIFFGYEQGTIDTNIAGNDSAPIALFTKVADKWWEFWEYQVGIKNNIGDFSSSWSQGIGESNISFALGDSSLDITLGLFRIGIGGSRTVNNTTIYNQFYINPAAILLAYALAPQLLPILLELMQQGRIPSKAH